MTTPTTSSDSGSDLAHLYADRLLAHIRAEHELLTYCLQDPHTAPSVIARHRGRLEQIASIAEHGLSLATPTIPPKEVVAWRCAESVPIEESCLVLTGWPLLRRMPHEVVMALVERGVPVRPGVADTRPRTLYEEATLAARAGALSAVQDAGSWHTAPGDFLEWYRRPRTVCLPYQDDPVSARRTVPTVVRTALATDTDTDGAGTGWGGSWSRLKIRFKDGHSVYVTGGTQKQHLMYNQIGGALVDGRNQEPSAVWWLFEQMARDHGVIIRTPQDEATRKKVERLSETLRDFFGICDDPIRDERAGRARMWKAQFEIRPEGD